MRAIISDSPYSNKVKLSADHTSVRLGRVVASSYRYGCCIHTYAGLSQPVASTIFGMSCIVSLTRCRVFCKLKRAVTLWPC